MNRQEQRAAALKAANDIVARAKAAGRENLTVAERDKVKAHLADVDRLDVELKREAEDAEIIRQLGGAPALKEATSLYAKGTLEQLGAETSGLGLKALLQGTVSTPSAVSVVPMPGVPRTLLDLVRKTPASENSFSYLRQVVRDEKATVVADGQLKPTSIYTFEEVEDRCRVIAHLSEPFPLRYLSDHDSMVQVLSSEMQLGVERALERELLAGDGTGEHFTGILNTSGARVIPFAGDLFTTMRKAITAAQNYGVTPTAWAINPTDAESLELIRENGDSGDFLLKPGDLEQRIFKLPVQVSPSIPVGKGILADWSTIEVLVREDTHTLTATQAGDLFDKNLVKLRAEGRFGLKVMQPAAISVVNLSA